MKRILTVSLVTAVLLVLAATVLMARSDGNDGGGKRNDTSERPGTTSATALQLPPGRGPVRPRQH